MDESISSSRRPIKARDSNWARGVAQLLCRIGVAPNHISYMSVVFAALAGGAYLTAPHCAMSMKALAFVMAALFIQGRLLCNLFDGMVAIEGGRKSKSGEIFNDFPDRVADPLILVCAGYAIPGIPHGIELGWFCGLLAVLTAYVRTLGKAAGASYCFLGPMAKQHRMAVMTVASIAGAVLAFAGYDQQAILLALALVAIGCLLTLFRRTSRIVSELESQ